MMALSAAKPHLGFVLSGAGFISGVLTWLQVITPVIGFIGALLGAGAGLITLLIKWREWRQGKK
jgi:hypothetical protein